MSEEQEARYLEWMSNLREAVEHRDNWAAVQVFFFRGDQDRLRDMEDDALWARVPLGEDQQVSYRDAAFVRLIDQISTVVSEIESKNTRLGNCDLTVAKTSLLIDLAHQACPSGFKRWYGAAGEPPALEPVSNAKSWLLDNKDSPNGVLHVSQFLPRADSDLLPLTIVHPNPDYKTVSAEKFLWLFDDDRFIVKDPTQASIDLRPTQLCWGDRVVEFQMSNQSRGIKPRS